jgi:NAD(P)-dependent dehydrogenase (short-subunit alcohol dehydrogenase family)
MMSLAIADKTVLVTGANRGLGRALVRRGPAHCAARNASGRSGEAAASARITPSASKSAP